MIASLIYSIFYTLIFFIPLYLTKSLGGSDDIFLVDYALLLIFSFTFKPNIKKICLSWLFIEIIFNIDIYYHLYLVSYPDSLTMIFDFSLYVLFISLAPISPLIFAYIFYKAKIKRKDKNSQYLA